MGEMVERLREIAGRCAGYIAHHPAMLLEEESEKPEICEEAATALKDAAERIERLEKALVRIGELNDIIRAANKMSQGQDLSPSERNALMSAAALQEEGER